MSLTLALGGSLVNELKMPSAHPPLCLALCWACVLSCPVHASPQPLEVKGVPSSCLRDRWGRQKTNLPSAPQLTPARARIQIQSVWLPSGWAGIQYLGLIWGYWCLGVGCVMVESSPLGLAIMKVNPIIHVTQLPGKGPCNLKVWQLSSSSLWFFICF